MNLLLVNVKTYKRLFQIGVCVLLIAGVPFVLISGSASKAMRELELGSTYEDLLAIAGPPSYETDDTLWVDPEHKKSLDEIIEGCAREVWYRYWLKFIPDKFSFCFSSDDILLHKYHWSSW